MNDPQIIFDQVSKTLKAMTWFKKGKWQTSTHQFPTKNPEALTFHVYKPHWYNDDRLGIHVESFLSLSAKARKKSYLTIHLVHHDLIPGTKIKRNALAKAFVDAVFDKVSGWEGYVFRAGKYGVQPFKLDLDGNSTSFAQRLVKEVSKVCRELGPKVDRALKEVGC